MPRSFPGRTLVAVRFVLGGASWFTPKFFIAATGLDPFANPQAAYFSRLFGVRDLALGIGLVATRGDARRLWWRLGIMCDLGDAAAGVLSARNGQLAPGRRTWNGLLAYAGVVGASLGAAALVDGDV